MPTSHGLTQALQRELSATTLEQAKHRAQEQQKPLLQYLIDEQCLSAKKIATACAEHFGLPSLDLHAYYHAQLPIDTINAHHMEQYSVLPIKHQDNTLTIAISNPDYFYQLEEIKFQTGCAVKAVIVAHDQLLFLINKCLSEKNSSQKNQSITQLVKQILNDAIHRKASDIHFEPQNNNFRIRLRIDGLLQTVALLDSGNSSAITSHLKVMANLDIAEKRLPQDGRFSFSTPSGLSRDCRVNCCPTLFGEKTVIRLLNPNNRLLTLDELGLEPDQQGIFLRALNKPQGLILVTGPTGSGKSITLYTALQYLNNIHKNISSAEDPVEIQLPGINQVNLNPKAGLDFPTILRALLRQDPDVIMIGEIRDPETAKMAIHAAQTGHLVLTTTHTNSAKESITRLKNLGIKAFEIAGTLELVIAQRLIRKRCTHCLPSQKCPYCIEGYQGRTGVFEIMEKPEDRTETLWQSALKKVKNNITTLEEVKRVIQRDS